MNDKNQEAFEKWFASLDESYLSRVIKLNRGASQETWQAACEYKQKEIDELLAENANLIEKISYLPKIPTQPYEKEMAQKIKNLENYVDKLEVALEKYAGHLGVLDEKL